MIQTQATIIERETLAPAWWRLTLSASNLSPQLRPGQFLLLRCGDYFNCYLHRPIFPQILGATQFSVLVRPSSDPGLAWLSARQVGDTLDIMGPLGNGFMLPNGIGNLLLVSDTQLLSPLLGPLEQALADGLAVTLVLEASRAANLYPAAQLPPAVELQAATHDGSQGHRGTIAPLLPGLLRWADAVYAAGTADLYRTLQQQTQSVRFGLQSGFLYGLIDTSPMACGVGACFSCTIETKFGLKLTCVDGPVFDLSAVELERP